MPAGRPTKYDPSLCQVVLEAGAEGKTKAAMAEACDVDRATLNEWCDKYPEFSRAVARGLQKAQVLWEDKGMTATFGGTPNFNATSYIFQMKNRFKEDWRDKQEYDHSSADGTMTPQAPVYKIVNE